MRTVVWAGRWTEHFKPMADHLAYAAKASIQMFTIHTPHKHMEGAGLESILDTLRDNRLSIRPPDVMIVGISTRDMRSLRDDSFLTLVRKFRHELDSIRFINGRAGASVPLLMTSEAISGGRTETVERNTYFVTVDGGSGVSNLATVTAGLLRVSRELFLGSLEPMGYCVLPENDRLTPYVVASDESFEGHSHDLVGNYLPEPNQLVSDRVGGWFVLQGQLVRGLKDAINEFEELINATGASERSIHDFLLRHPEFLYRNEFTRIWHEPRLAIPTELSAEFVEESVKPDFALGSDGPDDPLCLVELKLPSVPLLVADARQLSAKVHAGLAQLRKYKRYFADHVTASERNRVLGTTFAYPRCLLLVGRLPSSPGDLRSLVRIREDELPGVHLLTYDEVIAFQRHRVARG